MTIGKPCKCTHPLKFHCVECGAPLKSRGRSREWREKKGKRCGPYASRYSWRLKGLEKKEKPVTVQAPQVILHKTRTIVVHVNDEKALQRQINQIDSRVTVLEKNLPRTTVAKREIDVPDHCTSLIMR